MYRTSLLVSLPICLALIAALAPINPTSAAATPAARRWLLSLSDLDPETVSSVLKVYEDAGMASIAKRTEQVSIGSFSALILPAGGPKIRQQLQSTMSDKVLSIDNEVTWKLLATQANPPPGLDRLDTPRGALDRSFTFPDNAGEGVDVYVIDSGIDVNHADFGGRAQFLADFSGEGQSDLNGHGTHCASTAAGTRFGIAKQANVFAAKVFDASGSGSNFGVVQALQTVARSVQQRGNPSVINMSLGGPRGGDAATQRAIDSLVQLGAAVVVAAGNESQDACNVSPAFIPSAITVAANNPRDNRFANFSNRGRCVDIIAPGVQIEAARANSQSASAFLSGTSMASPHVAGIMAALMSQGLSRAQAQQTLLSSAVPNVVIGAPAGTRNLLAQLPQV